MQQLDFVHATVKDAADHFAKQGDYDTAYMFDTIADMITNRKQELLIKHQDEEN